MWSLSASRTNYLENTTDPDFIGRRRCGDVSISLDVKFLTLHCLFCKFENKRLNTFLNHLRSEHLSILAAGTLWLEPQEDDLEVKKEILEMEETNVDENNTKLDIEIEDDPLLTEDNLEVTTKKTEFKIDCEDDDDFLLDNILDDDTNHSLDDDTNHSLDNDTIHSLDENSITNDMHGKERPKDIHVFRLIDHFQKYPSLWYAHKKRIQFRQTIENIVKIMVAEFPNVKIDYEYVRGKINRLKRLYFNYNKRNQKYTVNEKKFYEKLHFLKGCNPVEGKRECTLCEKTVTDLERHIKKRHEEKGTPQTCKICEEVQPSQRHLILHVRSAHHRYECEYCNQWYAALKTLKNHIRNIHVDKPSPPMHPNEKLPSERICEYCGRQFGSIQVLNTHKKFYHLKLRPYSCSECSKAFTTREKLENHMNSAHLNVRPHICEVCSKGFFARKTLMQHMHVHSDVKNYVCKICAKAFKQSPALHCHMKIHQKQTFDSKFKDFSKKKILS